jgi:hypothetical protein
LYLLILLQDVSLAHVHATAGNTETAQTEVKVIQGDNGTYKSQHFNGACQVCVYKPTQIHSTNDTEKAIVSVFSEYVKKTKVP